MRTKGKIAVWDDERGFGFIEPNAGGQRVFVHIKAFRNRARRPEVGRSISYKLSRDEQGRPQAIRPSLVGMPDGWGIVRGLSICVAIAFFAFIVLAVLADLIPRICLITYPVICLVTFAMYGCDKSAARKHAWRTPEKILHLASLAGGWPGALVAQHTLHHKSKKVSFQIIFWATVLLNCGVLAWLCTPKGYATLQSFVRKFI